ncbi:MAG TPA: class II fumarate hydratase [Vicinamibacterales bacterium]|nr:class II fumarate hydratase [Vicinamibacterales bacterium]
MYRTEHDALGPVEVPVDRLWGAQTERSRHFFAIGVPRFVWTRPVIRALGLLKKCAALANGELGAISRERADLIARAADEVIAGTLDAEFPLVVFQTGSGTQSNMNANEVIANRANQLAGKPLGAHEPVHPNDHVNKGQSSNDGFPVVMHVAAVEAIVHRLLPAVSALRNTLDEKARAHADVVMIGRTHLQDAVPITLGQVIGGWVAQLDAAIAGVERSLEQLHELAYGATAVGTGLNAHPKFGETASRWMARETGQPFRVTGNHVAALSGHDAMAAASGTVRTLAAALMKMAGDVRLYSSGPRAGIGELRIPENEPGSSIMPGKINPTQCEAMTMVAVQVFGNDLAVSMANTQGHFQLNVYKPVILHNLLESVELLTDACRSFDLYCARGLEPNLERIRQHVEESLMLVTALNPHIGYENAAAIALKAHRDGLSLRDAALQSGHVTAEQFAQWVRPETMARPHKAD